jgi:F-type H+-transporting ATPase subunit delta
MRDTTIARNYAETLLALATKAGDLRGWGAMLGDVATAMETDPRLKLFLESPRISAAQKNKLLAEALQDRMPRLMVRYLQSLVAHRRQMLIPAIAHEYQDLVDAREGRLHAKVTVAVEPTTEDTSLITQQLSRMFNKDVIPHFVVDKAILGGVIVNVGDTVLDGSVRKRLASLRRRMITGR